MIALDLFAGTGWGVACQQLGITEYGVEKMPAAIATREAAGMHTIYHDVWEGLFGEAAKTVYLYDLLIASPPCQTFSVAGKGTGRAALTQVLAAITDRSYETPEKLWALAESLEDDRTALVLTPLAHVYRDRPRLVVLEQVPAVLPVWEACAEVMRALGYSVVTGLLNAEQYGVPQTRKRAILIARNDGIPAEMPTPTHSRYYSNNKGQLDIGVQPWISMAQALGWGMTERPYMTVATGTKSGGTDPMALGGSGARKIVHDERAAGRWLVSNYSTNGTGGVEKPGNKMPRARRFGDEPAHTMTSKAGQMVWDHGDVPAATVAGDPRLPPRGHHDRQMEGALRLTIEEGLLLQSYPADFPVQGNKGRQWEQIGNAVPPLLARAILAPLLA